MMAKRRRVTFEAQVSGDGECFCWVDVNVVVAAKITGEPDGGSVLYPNDVCWKLGCQKDKRYRFTVTAEEVEYATTQETA